MSEGAEHDPGSGVYSVGPDGPIGVLSAMVAEGLLLPVRADVYLAVDRWWLPQSRAAALAVLLGPALVSTRVVGGFASGWWHLVLTDCPVVDALGPREITGGSAPRASGVRVRQSPLSPDDVIDAGPVRVTSLPRAVADVARWAAAGAHEGVSEEHARDFARRAIAAGCPVDDISAALATPARMPGVAFARRLVHEQAWFASD